MPITITCDKCDQPFEVDDKDAGGRAACPYCGDVNRIPDAPQHAVASRPVAKGVVRASRGGGVPEGEEIVAVVRQAMFRAHPFIYSGIALVLLAGVVLAILAAASIVAAALVPVGLVVAAVAALALLFWWLAPHRWTKLVITTRRTIRQEGIVMRKTSEVLHSHVTNVVIEQGLIDRLLDVGYIGLDTAGQGGATGPSGARSDIEIEIGDVPRPYDVKALIDKYRL